MASRVGRSGSERAGQPATSTAQDFDDLPFDTERIPSMAYKRRDDHFSDRRRRKVYAFCADQSRTIDYKEVNRLRRYISERAKIEPRRKTGTCAQHQRLAVALKRARHVALLPYAPQHMRP